METRSSKVEGFVARRLMDLARVPTWVRVALPVAIYLGAFWLFQVVPDASGKVLDPWTAAYAAFRIFLMDPVTLPPAPTTMPALVLWVLLFLAPALVATAAADFVRRHILAPERLAKGLRGHVIVCGLGSHGRKLAELSLELGHSVLVLDKEPGAVGHVVDLCGGHALVLRGDMTEPDALYAAGIERASHIFLASGDPMINLVAAREARLASRGVRIHALVDEAAALGTVLNDMGLADVDLVDQFAEAATSLVEGKLQRRLEELAGGPRPARIAFVGFGRFGGAVLRAICAAKVGPWLFRPRVTVVDRESSRRVRQWQAGRSEGWTLVPAALDDALQWCCACREPYDRVIIGLDHDALGLRCAAILRDPAIAGTLVLRFGPSPRLGLEPLILCDVAGLFAKAMRPRLQLALGPQDPGTTST